MWDIVWVSPQGHRSVSVSRHFHLQAPQCPCSARKRFSTDHCCRGRSKPGCRIVGSHTRWELTTWADFQLCLHRRLMSSGCKSSHSGFLDVSRSNSGLTISGWIGHNRLMRCSFSVVNPVAVAALLLKSFYVAINKEYLTKIQIIFRRINLAFPQLYCLKFSLNWLIFLEAMTMFYGSTFYPDTVYNVSQRIRLA